MKAEWHIQKQENEYDRREHGDFIVLEEVYYRKIDGKSLEVPILIGLKKISRTKFQTLLYTIQISFDFQLFLLNHSSSQQF
jgi:hypothetical protein